MIATSFYLDGVDLNIPNILAEHASVLGYNV